ncbi:MAG: class I SAM-dependent methyltransferase [Microcystaceae cyanobacterium]
MGFYSQRIFPYLMDWSMSSSDLAKYRQETLANVKGEVLEIGFGTGLNLSYYPAAISKIVTVDVNPSMHRLAQKRIQASSITVDYHILSGENLPMAEETFDSVVSTFTLCSIPNVEQALKEIYRVLKPGGRFFFVEHGLSNEPEIQVWQNRLTPVQKVIADGCHLNRHIRQLVEHQFDALTLEEAYAENFPKAMAYFYQGVATKGNPGIGEVRSPASVR